MEQTPRMTKTATPSRPSPADTSLASCSLIAAPAQPNASERVSRGILSQAAVAFASLSPRLAGWPNAATTEGKAPESSSVSYKVTRPIRDSDACPALVLRTSFFSDTANSKIRGQPCAMIVSNANWASRVDTSIPLTPTSTSPTRTPFRNALLPGRASFTVGGGSLFVNSKDKPMGPSSSKLALKLKALPSSRARLSACAFSALSRSCFTPWLPPPLAAVSLVA
eukprot:scaffold1330_cov240-Pinguiococcus_pyrenoidosus.AAC.7